jgi:hypothetical protein
MHILWWSSFNFVCSVQELVELFVPMIEIWLSDVGFFVFHIILSQREKNDNTITVGDVLATYQVYQAFALYHGLSLQAETYQVPVTNQNSMISLKWIIIVIWLSYTGIFFIFIF